MAHARGRTHLHLTPAGTVPTPGTTPPPPPHIAEVGAALAFYELAFKRFDSGSSRVPLDLPHPLTIDPCLGGHVRAGAAGR